MIVNNADEFIALVRHFLYKRSVLQKMAHRNCWCPVTAPVQNILTPNDLCQNIHQVCADVFLSEQFPALLSFPQCLLKSCIFLRHLFAFVPGIRWGNPLKPFHRGFKFPKPKLLCFTPKNKRAGHNSSHPLSAGNLPQGSAHWYLVMHVRFDITNSSEWYWFASWICLECVWCQFYSFSHVVTVRFCGSNFWGDRKCRESSSNRSLTSRTSCSVPSGLL